jgi:vacuolar iron transporter family protein
MMLLLEEEGVAPADAARLAHTLAKYPRAYAKTMVEKELGIPLEPQTVRVAEGVIIGTSYIVGSIFPLIAYFFLPVRSAFLASLALTFVALIVVGIIKGKLARLNLVRSVIEILVVGGISAGGGHLLGSIVSRVLGF